MRKAIFPGSFDPFTVGHESIVQRAISLFDEIIIAIGHNANKEGFFPVGQRKKWIEEIFKNEPSISVEIYSGLTVEYCKQKDIRFILRGLRTATDFEYERAIGQVNRAMYANIETVYLLTLPEHTAISSTIVREIIRYQGDVSKFVPDIINNDLKNKNKVVHV